MADTPMAAASPAAGGGGDDSVDGIIEKLLSVRGARPGKQVTLTEAEIKHLCVRGKEVFMTQPILLELEVTHE